MTTPSSIAHKGTLPLQDVYLTEQDFADRYHVAPRTLQRWRTTGEGPRFVRFGARKVSYRLSDVEAWAADRVFASRADELARTQSI